MPISDGGSLRCGNNKTMNMELLKRGNHPFAVEWVWGLEASDGNDHKAMEACGSLLLAGWGPGEVNMEKIPFLAKCPQLCNLTLQ